MDSIVVSPAQVPAEVQVQVEEPTTYAWTQRDGEPWFWFNRFITYFLPLGPGRSIIKAYETMVAAEHPEVAEARRRSKKKMNATGAWSKKARDWDWRDRAKAYDRFAYAEALAEVDKARVTLLESANTAALTLAGALSDGRLKVAAAKEILDRVGLPGTVNVGVGPIEKFTADELRQAEREVDEWEPLPSPKSE